MSQPTPEHKQASSAFIALGGNVTSHYGTPQITLYEALRRLPFESLVVTDVSPFYATPAFPAGSGPDFVNAVARVETKLSPRDLLARLHEVERELGRERRDRWSARTIDLDLIAYADTVHPDANTFSRWVSLSLEDQQKLAPDGLILPHPRLQDRSFVLGPLCDIAPDWVHPVFGRSTAELFADLPSAERDELKRLDPPE